MSGAGDELREPIADGAAALEVSLDAPAVDALARLVAELLRWNRRINLVGRCGAEEAVDRHVHDALALLRLLDEDAVRARATGWYDVGAGPGLPGLVVALARPELRVELVEPRQRRVAFAEHAAALLGASNVRVRRARLEELPEVDAPAEPGDDAGGRPGGAMSRATFPPASWIRQGARLLPPGGLVLVMLGDDVPESLWQRAWRRDRVRLPRSGARRTNLLIAAEHEAT